MMKKIIKKSNFKEAIFIALAIILISIYALSITPVTLQNDTFYTIKIGELISNIGIDMQDHFSWHQDLAYTYPHWLYDLLTYIIYSMFNLDGIYIVTCILSCILGISLYLVTSKLSKNYVIPLFTTIGALYLIRGYITARAQLVTFILFIFTIYCIEMFLKSKKIRYGLGLILISLLIANLHCAVWPFLFVLFLPYIGEYVISTLADIIIYRKIHIFFTNRKIKRLKNKLDNSKKIAKLQAELEELQDKNKKIKIKRDTTLKKPYKIKIRKFNNTKWLILIMIICALMGLLTPIGLTPYTYLVNTMQGNTTSNINEHLPMTLSNQVDALCTIIIFLSIMTFTKAKINLNDLFMIGGLALLMLYSKRQLSIFAIIGAIILSRLLVNLCDIYDKDFLKNLPKKIFNPFAIILISLIVGYLSYNESKDKFDDSIIDESSYPVQACEYILENIDLGNARFYNEYNYGSYMLYKGIPVFIDSRADLYAPEFSKKQDDIFMDFIETSNISIFYEDTFKKYNITHVITYKNSKMNMIISKTNDSNYKELYSDEHFVIYKRLNQ